MRLHENRFYHIYNRGNNKGALFFEDRNYHYFKKLMAKYLKPHFTVYAYCLMQNHFHFLVKPINDSIQRQRAFQTLFSTYSKAINKAYNRTGSLFEDGYHDREIQSEHDFWKTYGYIIYNPLKHGFPEKLLSTMHSSYSDEKSSYIINHSELLTIASTESQLNQIKGELLSHYAKMIPSP